MITIKESTYDDIKNIQNLWADEDVMQYIWPGGLHETGEAVREWLDRFISARPKQNHYSIFEDGKYCGETQYRIDSETKNASLDIKLFEFARGRGIATQALLYSIQEAFKQGGGHGYGLTNARLTAKLYEGLPITSWWFRHSSRLREDRPGKA